MLNADIVKDVMRLSVRSISLWLTTAIAVVAVIFGVRAASAPDLKIQGSYKILVRGDYTGDGNAAVGAQSVTINAKVKDAAGNELHLVASSLKMENGRFHGTGKMGGTDVRVNGRVDPPGNLLKAARLTATFGSTTEPTGRIVGDRKGS